MNLSNMFEVRWGACHKAGANPDLWGSRHAASSIHLPYRTGNPSEQTFPREEGP